MHDKHTAKIRSNNFASTHGRHGSLIAICSETKGNRMANDNFETLMNARAVLARKRLNLIQAIATGGDNPSDAIKGLVELQQGIEVIDATIEELEEAELQEELEDE